MFQNLQKQINESLKFIRGKHKITEINIAHTIKNIKRCLLNADVAYEAVNYIIEKVKKESIGKNVISDLQPEQLMIKIIKDELQNIMGNKVTYLKLINKPTIILLIGLQGVGKTTFAAKLALYLKNNNNKKIAIIAADSYRYAAIKQLRVLGEKINIPVYYDDQLKKPIDIINKIVNIYPNNEIFIIDTAGRLAINDELIEEIKHIQKNINISDILYIADSMYGQDAILTARKFNEKIGFTGIVMTKLDSDSKGGAMISISYITGKPIKFISTGEKLNNIDLFYPDRMASRILGMGDIVSLVEKVQKEYKNDYKSTLKNKFNLNDFIHHINKIKNIGNIKELANMLPLNNFNINNIDDNIFNDFNIIINSMTYNERLNPNIINKSRILRIAKGCGKNVNSIENMLKYFNKTKKMMIDFSNKKLNLNSIFQKVKKDFFK